MDISLGGGAVVSWQGFSVALKAVLELALVDQAASASRRMGLNAYATTAQQHFLSQWVAVTTEPNTGQSAIVSD